MKIQSIPSLILVLFFLNLSFETWGQIRTNHLLRTGHYYFGNEPSKFEKFNFNNDTLTDISIHELDSSFIQEWSIYIQDTNGNLDFFGAASLINGQGNLVPFHLDDSFMYTVTEVVYCPNPANLDQYYLFGERSQYTSTLRYTIIDKSLNSGEGGIVMANQEMPDVPLGKFAEGVEVIKNPAEESYWVIGYDDVSKGYWRWKIDENGVSAGVKILDYDYSFPGGPINYGLGELDFHIDYFAHCLSRKDRITFFKFDPITGEASNLHEAFFNGPNDSIAVVGYGLEFSIDRKFLYTPVRRTTDDHTVESLIQILRFKFNPGTDQFELEGPVYQKLFDYSGVFPGGAERGPDCKIYITQTDPISNQPYSVFIIEDPGNNIPTISVIESTVRGGGGFSDPIQYPEDHVILDTSNFQVLCNLTDSSYVLEFDLLGTPSFTFSGINGLLDGNHFVSESYQMNTSFEIAISDSYFCTPVIISGIAECTSFCSDPPPSLNPDTTYICEMATALLDASVPGAITYLWNTGSDHPIIEVTSPGVYSVDIVYHLECPVFQATFIVEESEQIPPIVLNESFCDGSEILLNSQRNNSILSVWSTGEIGLEITVQESGTYTLYSEFEDACPVTDTFHLLIMDPPEPINEEAFFCEGSSLTLESPRPNSNSSFWSSGETGLELSIQAPGIYTLYSELPNECSVTDTFFVVPLNGFSDQFYIPNSFSPNNDGNNDLFKPLYRTDLKVLSYHFLIFDRWGGIVFESFESTQSWDGQAESSKPNGANVFTWRLELDYLDCNNQPQTILDYGNVTIIK